MQAKAVAITGHTRGLGKGVYDLYTSQNLEVLGFSKSTGYDISDPSIIDSIIKETAHCDLFINNAFHDDAQSEIANKWFELHYDKPHLIVNISSIATVANDYVAEQHVYEKYGMTKQRLDRVGWRINFANKLAKCITVSPAVIDTDMAHPGLYDQLNADGKLLLPVDVATVISSLVEQYNARWFVPHVYLINNTGFN